MLSSTVAVYSSILLYVCVLSDGLTFLAKLVSRIVVSFDPNKMVANFTGHSIGSIY
jgi:hypoxanthine-guanine phosphoribosyltransferase